MVGPVKREEGIVFMKKSWQQKSKMWRAIGWTVVVVSVLTAIFVTINAVL
jgi:hypothetical protein